MKTTKTKKTIKRMALTAVAAVAIATQAAAQTDNRKDIDGKATLDNRFDDSALQRIMPTRFGGRSRKWREQMADEGLAEMTTEPQDSLTMQLASQNHAQETVGRYPLNFGGWYDWGLHRGFNVQVGLSVFAEFGKGARSGAGFQQDIALMYATPINDKLSVAVGGYLNNVNYAGGNWHDAGLAAVLGYRFNEHWEAYIYGQKSITNNEAGRLRYSMYDGYYGGYGVGGYGQFSRNFFGMPNYSAYDISGIGDRIGATVRYNFNNNMSIQVSVENIWLPDRR